MSRRSWLLFAAMALLWGFPYFLIKVAERDLEPSVVVFGRLAVGAAVLLPLALRQRAFRGLRGSWGAIALQGLVGVALPFLLITFGEQRISSSLAGLLIAADPLLLALLALRFDRGERVSGLRLAGLLVGVVGVAALLGLDAGRSGGRLLGAGMVLLAALGYAAGALMVRRRFAGLSRLGTVTGTLLVATALTAVPAGLSRPAGPPSAEALAAVLAMGLLCTAVAYLCYFALIAAAGAGRAVVVTYANPAVAVALGALVLGEPVTAATWAGFLLVIAGSWLATRSPGRRPPPRGEESGSEGGREAVPEEPQSSRSTAGAAR